VNLAARLWTDSSASWSVILCGSHTAAQYCKRDRRLPVNSSHDKLVTRSTCHILNSSQSSRHTTNSSHGQVVTLY